MFLAFKKTYSDACTGIFPKHLCTSQASDVIYFSHNKEYNHAQTSVKDREKMFEIDKQQNIVLHGCKKDLQRVIQR